jgi:hypothetical protein
MGDSSVPVTHTFLRNMLWRHGDVPEPIVALLGPRGSGKSTALDALSLECGGTVVHARLDFGDPKGIDAVAGVGFVAFELMRSWRNRPHDPTFHRVGLSLLALNERLEPDRDAARRQIDALVRQYVRGTRRGEIAATVGGAVSSSVAFATALTGIDATPQGAVVRAVNERAKPVIVALLQRAARLNLRGALDWQRSIPQAEQATTIDSMIALSRTRRHDALNHLMHALLADIEDNVTRRPEVIRGCRCLPAASSKHNRHEHVWVLTVDNADNDRGRQFLAALLKARKERAVVPAGARPRHDPLLVVTAVDRWNAAWGRWWQEPWQSTVDSPPRQRVPLFSQASRDQWSRHARAVADAVEHRGRGWYPVWLDPLGDNETATMAAAPTDGPDKDAFDAFVRGLSGNRPSAVVDIREQLMANPPAVVPGDPVPRSVLGQTGGEDERPLWERAVRSCLPGDPLPRRPWRAVPAAVAVAAHLVEPGRTLDDLGLADHPDVVHALHALQSHLWISTFEARPSRLRPVTYGDTEQAAALHPWPARCLFAGLAAESATDPRRTGTRMWEDLFTSPPGDASAGGQVHTAAVLFRDLACDRFDPVVAALAARFDVDDHLTWVRLLDDVTGAPCRSAAVESTEVTVARLVPEHVEGRTAVQATVTDLVALLWLYRDPLTVPANKWDERIHDAFEKLAFLSTRQNLRALRDSAAQFQEQ